MVVYEPHLLICDNNKELHGNLGPIVGDRFSVVAFLPSVITSKAANHYHFKTGQREEPVRDQFLLPCCLLWRQVGFGAPTSRTTLEHVAVMQETVEHGGDRGRVA